MSKEQNYTLPTIWQWKTQSGGQWANVNRPISGSTHEKELPVGKHPIQLYSLATPNGVKVTLMLEELLSLGHLGAEYDAHLIEIGEGQQFGSGFVDINPNSKIPALVDRSTEKPSYIFESGAILLYLAEKFDALIPCDPSKRVECLSWLFWQMGSAPYLGGGFGHFYSYAPDKIEYCINRFSMEVKRQLHVLDTHLADKQFICGEEYTIADIAIWPWYGALSLNKIYDAAEFLQTQGYTHLMRWSKEIEMRNTVKRAQMVNRTWGIPEEQLHERHSAADFEIKSSAA